MPREKCFPTFAILFQYYFKVKNLILTESRLGFSPLVKKFHLVVVFVGIIFQIP